MHVISPVTGPKERLYHTARVVVPAAGFEFYEIVHVRFLRFDEQDRAVYSCHRAGGSLSAELNSDQLSEFVI